MGKERHCSNRGLEERGWRGMWHVGGTGEFIQSFGGGPGRKRPLGRPRRRGDDNIKTNIQKVGWGGMYRIHLVKDRDGGQALVNAAINLNCSAHLY